MNYYPRPQLQRANWLSLDGPWQFAFVEEGVRYSVPSQVESWPLVIEVPFAPECSRSGIGDTTFHRECWYRRSFNYQRPEEGKVLLHFGAVDFYIQVWVNDIHVASHCGGFTPFTTDVTHALDSSGTQSITVQVVDDPKNMEKPRGKQDWLLEPHSIWYYRTTGIWQTVWLETVHTTYVNRLRWTPNLERWEIGCEALIEGHIPADLQLKVRLYTDQQLLSDDSYQVTGTQLHRRIELTDPGIEDFRNELLWSPEHPRLIHAQVQLIQGSRVLDDIVSYTALRSVNVHRDRFLLNGRLYPLRLVLDQGYWPDTLMTPPSDEALRKDVELVKAMGFNGVRKHQKLEDPRYLYWADTLGLVVWTEMPSAYRFSTRSIEWLMREWMVAIERDYNHPCIIGWIPFNESWGVPDLTASQPHRDAIHAFYHLTKALDPTRPVIGNDGWESSATDIIGIHDYDHNPATLRDRYGPLVKLEDLFDRRRPGGRVLTLDGFPHQGQPIMLTEFGGVAFVRPTDSRHSTAWGYIRSEDLNKYEQLVLALIEVARTTTIFSGFCYTQFTDTFQEANGLLYSDRSPKIPLEKIAEAVRGVTAPGALAWESL